LQQFFRIISPFSDPHPNPAKAKNINLIFPPPKAIQLRHIRAAQPATPNPPPSPERNARSPPERHISSILAGGRAITLKPVRNFPWPENLSTRSGLDPIYHPQTKCHFSFKDIKTLSPRDDARE